MRIGIDARPIQGRFAGDCTYWRGLITGLSTIDSPDEIYIYLDARMPIPDIPPAANIRVSALRAASWRVWSVFAFPRALRRDRIDVAHVQYTIPPYMPCPVVTSIHDVSFKRHPEFFHLKDRLILDAGVRRAGRQAARILAISRYTAKEIKELYRIPDETISVVYPGVDEQFRPMDRAQTCELAEVWYGIRWPFALTVGVIQPRKNLPRLLEGFAILKEAHRSDLKLVIVGKRGWKDADPEKRVGELGLRDDVIFPGFVPDEHLPALYNACKMFVYPSVYEGFGLPPLEAMACGTPVITGNRSSLPEVVGDAGIMVDPYKPQAFADAMARVLMSEDLRAEMSLQGIEQASRFRWSTMALEMMQIYRESAG